MLSSLLLAVSRSVMASNSCWVYVGPLARTCSEAMQRLCSDIALLDRVVEYFLANKESFPKWLTFALPSRFVSVRKRPPIDLPECALVVWQTYGPDIFYSGGSYVQQELGLKWSGDLDFWARRSSTNLYSYVICEYLATSIDVMLKEYKEVQRCIELFDMSIVQSGMRLPSTECFCTPLYAYSVEKKVNFVFVRAPSMCYDAMYEELKVALPQLVAFHYAKHSSKPLHECFECRCEFDEPNCWQQRVFASWLSRVYKYSRRLKGFTFAYVYNTLQ